MENTRLEVQSSNTDSDIGSFDLIPRIALSMLRTEWTDVLISHKFCSKKLYFNIYNDHSLTNTLLLRVERPPLSWYTKLLVVLLVNRVSIPDEGRAFFFCTIETCFGTHPVSYSTGTAGDTVGTVPNYPAPTKY
jgi:hypothetical protein